MNHIKQQLERVVVEMRKANNALSPPSPLVRQRWVYELSAIVEQMPSASHTTPQLPDGMVLVPEVLLRQIAKWLAESADPYDKAAYAINGLIAAAKDEG